MWAHRRFGRAQSPAASVSITGQVVELFVELSRIPGRRRKIKCTWTYPNAPACRRCEERGSVCEAQVRISEAREKRKLSSRERIARLEAQLGRLSGVVGSLQSRVDGQPADSATTTNSAEGFESLVLDAEINDDKSSTDSEVIEEDLSTRMHSLFENDVLRTDAQENARAKQEQSSRSVAVSLKKARTALQSFIPPKSEIQMNSDELLRWQRLLYEIMPLGSPPQSPVELLSSYDAMLQPDVDAMALAAWLLLIVTVWQPHSDDGSPSGFVRRQQSRASHFRVLTELVETHILSHDSLIGSVRGINVAMMNARA